MEEDCSNFILRNRKSHLGKKHVLANILHIPSSNLNRKSSLKIQKQAIMFEVITETN